MIIRKRKQTAVTNDYIDNTWSNFIFKFKFSSFRYSYTGHYGKPSMTKVG